ncbi:SH2 domain-containing adapter protein F-like isoform X2 [Ptychodera flava]|uniref:SH2 domain-containing adapter protein F-like isoform X2 n=1 Tax=Ptychodera flava TaxID=63121 RepID=UPI003969DE49
MAKLFKHLLGKKSPPQPPEPDYDAKNGRRSRSWDYESDEDALPDYIGEGRLSSAVPTFPIAPSNSPPTHQNLPYHEQQQQEDINAMNSKPRPHSHVGSISVDYRANADNRPTECKQTPTKAKKTFIVEDYSDPFDIRKAELEGKAAQAPLYEMPPDGPISGKGYDEDDYTEPYEAQKIVQQIREAKKKEAEQNIKDDKCLVMKKIHVYEDPYDPEISKQSTTADAAQQDCLADDKRKLEGGRYIGDSSYDVPKGCLVAEHSRYSQCHELDDRPKDEYDEPWDWRAKNRISKAILDKKTEPILPKEAEQPEPLNGDSSNVCNTNQQVREKDVRPVDEYEIPWDWKPKDRLSQALLGDFGSSKSSTEQVKNDTSPEIARPAAHCAGRLDQVPISQGPNTVEVVKNTDSPRQSPKRSGLKLDIKPKIETLGEVVDPTIPLEEQRWYHGKLSRQDAELVLRNCDDCSYLVRQSESGGAKDYSLSLKVKTYKCTELVKYDR